MPDLSAAAPDGNPKRAILSERMARSMESIKESCIIQSDNERVLGSALESQCMWLQ